MIAKKTTRNYSDLKQAGLSEGISPDQLDAVARQFSIAITPDIIEIARFSDPTGRVAKQFVPDPRELIIAPDEVTDPIGDEPHSPLPGIIHRYPDRVLLNVLHSCPVYCRYCFRRERVGVKGQALSVVQLKAAFDYITETPQIEEVILSGGDPLLLADKRLASIMSELEKIPHVGTHRIHTRVPIVSPSRITDELLNALKGTRPTYIVIHCNHPDELSPKVVAALAKMSDSGFPLLSQSVLLAGVNDDFETLSCLFRKLVRHRVKPYYLHQLDRARGTAHFRTSIAKGQELVRRLRETLSGLCQPTYVLDLPGGYGKVPLTPLSLALDAEGQYRATDPQGGMHLYRDSESEE